MNFIPFAKEDVRISDVTNVVRTKTGKGFKLQLITPHDSYYEEFTTEKERDTRYKKVMKILDFDPMTELVKIFAMHYFNTHRASNTFTYAGSNFENIRDSIPGVPRRTIAKKD